MTCKNMIALPKIANRKVAICFGHLFKDPESNQGSMILLFSVCVLPFVKYVLAQVRPED